MRLYDSKEACYGCGACQNICPKSSISMQEDEQGFKYPVIDSSRCIECGLCRKACQINKEKNLLHTTNNVCYGVKNSDDIRRKSSSGGVYTSVSDYILREDGICAGVLFDDAMKAVFRIAHTERERDLFRGSKYVQGDTDYIYSKIAHWLKQDKIVLFSGTPCQVGGLILYLEARSVDTARLILNDIVCHGVPSPLIWEKYINFLQSLYGSKIISYSFRDKSIGWKGYHVSIEFENGVKVADNVATQSFIKLFVRDVMLRPSCYRCPYASCNRVSDITIGDFWGIEKIDRVFDDNVGISMVLVNTEKGEQLFDQVCKSKKMTVNAYPTANLTQPNLYRATDRGMFYTDFWKTFFSHGYYGIAKKYAGYGSGQFLYRVRDSFLYRFRLLKDRFNHE